MGWHIFFVISPMVQHFKFQVMCRFRILRRDARARLLRCVRRKATRVVSPHAVSTGGSPDIHVRERRQGRESRRHRRPAGCSEVVCTAGGTGGGFRCEWGRHDPERNTHPPLLSVPGPTAAADS